MLRKLLALIMMPLVKKCFEDLVEKLAERNIDEVNTKSEKKVSSKPINKNASSHVEVQHQEEITAKLEKIVISQEIGGEIGGPQIGG